MSLFVKNEGIVLSRTDEEFENEGILNPAILREGDSVHVLYRAVSKGNHSSIGYCRLDGPLTAAERHCKPLLVPEFDYESQGIEDPRIVRIDDLYYLTYTAYDGTNARGALATSTDMIHFEKRGIIVPPFTYAEFVCLMECAGRLDGKYSHNYRFYYEKPDQEKKMLLWDKNVLFFPRRIDGKLAFLHRIRPGIQIVLIDSLENLTRQYWEGYVIDLQSHILMDPRYPHEAAYIGGGCPPIETKEGWLLIYHGVKKTEQGFIYSACAALLDLNDPAKEIARLPYALFSPEREWERNGEVANVVFPTGTAIFGTTLFIYYGAADSRIGCASVSLPALIFELLQYAAHTEA